MYHPQGHVPLLTFALGVLTSGRLIIATGCGLISHSRPQRRRRRRHSTDSSGARQRVRSTSGDLYAQRRI